MFKFWFFDKLQANDFFKLLIEFTKMSFSLPACDKVANWSSLKDWQKFVLIIGSFVFLDMTLFTIGIFAYFLLFCSGLIVVLIPYVPGLIYAIVSLVKKWIARLPI